MPLKEEHAMTPSHSSVALADRAPEKAQVQDVATIETRFGTFEVDLDKTIAMSQGLIGFAHLRRFALLDVPGAEQGGFKLFQSLDDTGVSFIVLPLSEDSGAIDPSDLDAACEMYGVARANAAFLLIATVRRAETGGATTTVNLKAPLLVDTEQRSARQVIFSDQKYSTRHPLL
jgi:flagellar assembly factor FliW